MNTHASNRKKQIAAPPQKTPAAVSRRAPKTAPRTSPRSREGFLPVCAQDLRDRGIEQLDFVYVIGDAYVDHPSFGPAVISRVLESRGYTVGIISQPDWRDPGSVTILGEPRLAFLVSSGNMDSMVNHYTSAKKRRHEDAYSPGGAADRRPDNAVVVYGNLIRKTYKKPPVVIGGLEASLRRLAHYDYWQDKVRRSILLDAGADLLSYGMGEHSIVEIADALASGLDVRDITFIRGTVCKIRSTSQAEEEVQAGTALRLPDYAEVKSDRRRYAESFAVQYRNTDPFSAKRLYEYYDGSLFILQNPPAMPLTTREMDDVYALPYQRTWHPDYDAQGGIPALGDIRFSLTSNRGCFGDCHFCALTFHEGRIVQVRSHESIVAEAEQFLQDPDFKGYIYDVGGPTAEFRAPACSRQLKSGACTHRTCLVPEPCPNLRVDHSDYLRLLRRLRELPGVKKVFVRSGFRFDYLLADPDRRFLAELCEHHISGQLRVAPEHVSDPVLACMGKPSSDVYHAFSEEFENVQARLTGTGRLRKRQYMVPYLMSSHPGSTLRDAIALAESVRDLGYMPEQVQDFYPTPGTISTCMYYTGLDPLTMQPVYVARDPHEKAMQRALIQYRDPANYALVKEALLKAGRSDLIGFGPKCLIPPRPLRPRSQSQGQAQGQSRSQSKSQAQPRSKSRSQSQSAPARKEKNAPVRKADTHSPQSTPARKASRRSATSSRN